MQTPHETPDEMQGIFGRLFQPTHKDLELHLSEQGYIRFLDTRGMKPPGILWELYSDGWHAFVNNGNEVDDNPIFRVRSHTFPSDDELASAAKAYEKQCSP